MYFAKLHDMSQAVQHFALDRHFAEATDLAILSDLREPSGNAPSDFAKPNEAAANTVIA